ncbi:AraC family transcriptional regulator [Alkalicoccobacillus porphyridii]|uniref:AraC family transcriptional regulator n=1 Tax=Alkalicoccobacillus porphyridii TaxID=2597270 RepID=A0A554A270_9BACI|nr:AraC family transcriptional regulator [Alkalicoccobacillus porphyridii]TSB47775.1 AraC family transcriptional regulator [Alkalicoccobacillus porphyridii]
MNEFIYKKHKRIKALSARMSDFSYKKHSHGEYAIGVTLRGIQQYQLDGSHQLSHQGGVMFFNPEQVHDGSAYDETGLEYAMLYFEPSLLLEATQHKESIQFTEPIIYNQTLSKHVLHLANAVLHDKNECICDERLIKLADHLTGFHQTYSPHQDSIIQTMKEEIHLHLKDQLRLDTISEQFGLSKFQFIRYFKAQTGVTPYQYYLNGKIDGARKIIEQEKDVFMAVNEFDFVDLTHLNRQFKKVYGITANDYANHM